MNSSIKYGYCNTIFGTCFVALEGESVCMLHFPRTAEEQNTVLDELKQLFPEAELKEDPQLAESFCNKLFTNNDSPINLILKGSALQLAVWEALLTIERGAVATYSQIAELAGNPRAVRAVATAIGQNPVCYLVPCHRVIRKSGEIGNYRWGSEIKKAMLHQESHPTNTTQPITIKTLKNNPHSANPANTSRSTLALL